MFGYVTVNEPELRIREYHLYRSYYCGMCMDLKDNYGQSGRMTLSYDTVFLALLLTSLYEPPETLRSVRCAVHPLEKHATRQNAYTRYAADMNIILSYYSCVDDWNDEKEMKKKLMANVLRGKNEKAGSLYPEKARVIRENLDRLHELENRSRAGTDRVGTGASAGRLLPGQVYLYSGCIRRSGEGPGLRKLQPARRDGRPPRAGRLRAGNPHYDHFLLHGGL